MLKGMKARRQLAAFVALAVGGGSFAAATAAEAADVVVGTGGTVTGVAGTGSAPDPYGNIVGSNLSGGAPTGNTLTVGGGVVTTLPVVNGYISAAGSGTETYAVTGNTLIINTVNLTGNAYGGYAANIVQTSGAAQTSRNRVQMNNGTVYGALVGGRSSAGGATTGEVELAGGTLTAGTDGIAIAGGMGRTSAINNDVTITGGTVTGNIYGGYAENPGAKTTGNNVYLGDTNGTYSANLLSAALYGGNDGDYANNHLHVRAKNIMADAARNFNTYRFELNTGVDAGDTMLTLTNNNNALGRNVDWSEIHLDAEGWSGRVADGANPLVRKYYGNVGTVTLMADGNSATNRGSNLSFSGYTSPGTTSWSGDYEYRIGLRSQTTLDSPSTPLTSTTTTRNYVTAELHRYQNADATYNSAAVSNGTIYGGYSIWVNKVVQDNELRITNAAGSMTAYGGYTSTGADAVRNKLIMTGGTVQNLYGAHATGSGTVADNSVSVTGATVTGAIIGGRSAGPNPTGVVQKNTVVVDNSQVTGSITGGSGKTIVDENAVTIQGDLITNSVHSIVNGNILGGYIEGDTSVNRSASKNSVTITEGDIRAIVYGVFGDFSGIPSATTTQSLTENSVTISGGAEHQVYGAYLTGIGVASKNTVEVSGTADVGGTIFGAATAGDGILTENSVTVKGGSAHNIYGAYANGTGAVSDNKVTVENGIVHDDVYGGYNHSSADNAGAVTGNHVTIAGGSLTGDIYGGMTERNTSGSSTNVPASGGNIITITGGRIGGTRADGLAARGDVYGGYANGTDQSVETNNTINLGKDDGSYETGMDLSNARFYGGRNSSAGNTLNVKAKDITVKGVHNFENYKFFLTDKVNAGDTMLTLTEYNGFGNSYSSTARVNFANVGIDLTNMSARQIAGTVTLVNGAHANALQFQNYNPRGTAAPTETNGDYEYALRTDTDTAVGQKVLLDYNRFQNGIAAYDPTSTETDWFAGRSYGGHTTTNNKLTVNAALSRDITVYGGKTLGTAGGSTNNTVEIQSTGTNYEVSAAYAGFIGRSSNADGVENNTLRMTGGVVRDLYGGSTAGTGVVSGNEISVTGGTVRGNIYAGDAPTATQVQDNRLILGGDDGSYDATIEGEIFGSRSGVGTGNTLIVQAGKEVSVQKVHNFDRYKFILHNNALIDQTMLKIRDVGGLDNTVAWNNIDVDLSKFTLDPRWMGSHHVTLIDSLAAMTFSGYSARDLTPNYATDPYEVYLHTDRNASNIDGAQVRLTVNRLRSGDRRYDGTNESDLEIFTGRSAMGYSVENNVLRLEGIQTGNIPHFAAAGVSTAATGDMTNNRLVINSENPMTLPNVYGAYASNTATDGKLTGNAVTMLRGALTSNVYGAYTAGTEKAENNAVQIMSGTVTGDVYGGYSVGSDAAGNTIDLHAAAAIIGDVIGGQGTGAKDNVINLRGAQVSGAIYGGRIRNGIVPVPAATLADNNTLNIYDMGSQARYFEGIGNINFYLTPNANIAQSMLTLTQDSHKDLRGTNIKLDLDGGHAPIHKGDIISLIKLPDAQHLETDVIADQTTTQGVTLNYVVGFETRNTLTSSPTVKSELIARVKDVVTNDQTKSLVETQAASIALLASGSDLIADVGIPAAEMAAAQMADLLDTPISSRSETNGAAPAAPLSSLGSYQMFAAQSFGNVRLNSGSHVDAKGWNINVGYARRNELASSALTFGPFVEYGRGSYDSYLDDGTHGDGKTSYLGIGIMAKSENDSGNYVEGSLRVGRAKTDYNGKIGVASTSYDTSSTYFAGHIGVGNKRTFINGNKIETYAKYFYAHQAGTSAKLSSGETYDFGASASNRFRVGTRYSMKNEANGEFYAGLAWEYEFDGKGTASYQGFDLPSTSLKGSTTLLELGYRFAPADSAVSYGLNLTGFKGKRKGITGGLNIAWAF